MSHKELLIQARDALASRCGTNADERKPGGLLEAMQVAIDAPEPEPEGVIGAIVNGRVYADRLERGYNFECEAGPLRLCSEWVEFLRCFEWLAEHANANQEPPKKPS